MPSLSYGRGQIHENDAITLCMDDRRRLLYKDEDFRYEVDAELVQEKPDQDTGVLTMKRLPEGLVCDCSNACQRNGEYSFVY